MTQNIERRRVLLAAPASAGRVLREQFERDPLLNWDYLEVDNFSKARFVLQHHPCDVLLVHDELVEREGSQGLAWLAWHRETPVVLLAGDQPERYSRAYELGISVCLPRMLAVTQAGLLAAAMQQAIKVADLKTDMVKVKDQLGESRKHIDRLVNMLWRSSTVQAEGQWFPQRSMMERLSEELSRTQRHGSPLTLAIGEIHRPESNPTDPLPDWAPPEILKTKRRCDVAGQYGPHGFLLLMVHTRQDGAVICCRRLQQVLESGHELRGPHRPMRAYFGLASLGAEKGTPQALLRQAEEHLERAHENQTERLIAG